MAIAIKLEIRMSKCIFPALGFKVYIKRKAAPKGAAFFYE
jgi:hypothetical protein